jgi:hypothetical protein
MALRTVTSLVWLLLLVVGVSAFQVPTNLSPRQRTLSSAKAVSNPANGATGRRPLLILEAKKGSLPMNKKKKKGENNDETLQKMPSPTDLFLAFMTPWRNPNSLFVYMLIILYTLGKYSEAHPH